MSLENDRDDNDFSDTVLRVGRSKRSHWLRTYRLKGQGELLDLKLSTDKLMPPSQSTREADFDDIIGFTSRWSKRRDWCKQWWNGRHPSCHLVIPMQRSVTFRTERSGPANSSLYRTIDGRAIFAPFIIADGTVDQVLNGGNYRSECTSHSWEQMPTKADRAIRLLGNDTFGFSARAG